VVGADVVGADVAEASGDDTVGVRVGLLAPPDELGVDGPLETRAIMATIAPTTVATAAKIFSQRGTSFM